MNGICLVMIFKDDAATIERSLISVKPWVQSYFLIDAGSRDGSAEMALTALQGVSGVLAKSPWAMTPPTVSSLLRAAKQHGDYLLLMEPDEILKRVDPLDFRNLDRDYYEAISRQDEIDWKRPFLLRASLNWKGGDLMMQHLHSLEAKSSKLLFEALLLKGSSHRASEEKKKLQDALRQNPLNANLVFHYARACERAGCDAEALEWYERRVTMAGDAQEVFYALYRVAALGEKRGDPLEVVIDNYLLAYHAFPSRAEPLYDLAERMIRDENYVLGYVLAEYALSLSLQQDPFFQKRWIYEYGLLRQFALCAFEIKRYDESKSALNRLLKMRELPSHLLAAAQEKLLALNTPGGFS